MINLINLLISIIIITTIIIRIRQFFSTTFQNIPHQIIIYIIHRIRTLLGIHIYILIYILPKITTTIMIIILRKRQIGPKLILNHLVPFIPLIDKFLLLKR